MNSYEQAKKILDDRMIESVNSLVRAVAASGGDVTELRKATDKLISEIRPTYAAIYVYGGGVIQHVEIGTDLEALKESVLETVTKFEPSDDTVQIWDDKGSIVWSYVEDSGKFKKCATCEDPISVDKPDDYCSDVCRWTNDGVDEEAIERA